jgi:O-antigen ligase
LISTIGAALPHEPGLVADYVAIQDPGAGGRTIAWAVGARMANDYALTGSGFGAFREVFPAYQPRGDADVWLQMHNDYLELYQAGGMVAAALVAWLAIAVALRAVRVLRSEFALGRGLSSLGLAIGLCAMAVHELVDFNLQVPANALLFVALAAMGVSSAARSPEAP